MGNKKQRKPKRSAERELAFRSLFQLSFHEDGQSALEGIHAFLEGETENKTEESLEINAGDFTHALISAVVEQQEQIDTIIRQYIREDWSMERLPNVEKTVLRLAAAEMLYLNTPKEIAINEAVQLVKNYGDEEAFRFVNGILHHMAEDYLKKEAEEDAADLSGD